MVFNKEDNLFNRIKVSVISIIVITTIIFSFTVIERRPWFGLVNEANTGIHHWLTGSALKFERSWYRDGAVNDWFTMYEYPASVDYRTAKQRVIYDSYPPGCLLPTYLIDKIRGHEPSPGTLMGYNLFVQLIVTLLLALIVFFSVLNYRKNCIIAFILSMCPVLIYLLTPGAMYYHQNVYWSDQAVLIFFAAFVFIELLWDWLYSIFKINSEKHKKLLTALRIIQAVIAFLGVFTDWLFVFVYLCVYLKRLFRKEMGNKLIYKENGDIVYKKLTYIKTFIVANFKFWLPGAIAILLYIAQLLHNKTVRFLEMFAIRTGEVKLIDFYNIYFKGFMVQYLGEKGIFIFALVISIVLLSGLIWFVIFCLKRKGVPSYSGNVRALILPCILFLMPCLMCLIALKQHNIVHSFTVLKLLLPFGVSVPLMWLLISSLYFEWKKLRTKQKNKIEGKSSNAGKRVLICLSCAVLVLTSLFSFQIHGEYKKLFAGKLPYGIMDRGNFIKENTNYNDMVFSNDISITKLPPQDIAFSTKAVYKVGSISEIKEIINDRDANDEEYVVNIYVELSDIREDNPLYNLAQYAFDVIIDDSGSVLYKVRKEDFLNIS